ncbi:unnamed protein product [Citrullus colocynthis]|uniref:Uncharacterized protein n=1 Tax=Citrullus colocynthis TaxID=252529 RepID=A0ABP0Z3A2_9ROSI
MGLLLSPPSIPSLPTNQNPIDFSSASNSISFSHFLCFPSLKFPLSQSYDTRLHTHLLSLSALCSGSALPNFVGNENFLFSSNLSPSQLVILGEFPLLYLGFFLYSRIWTSSFDTRITFLISSTGYLLF